jgi:hypothetical protein
MKGRRLAGPNNSNGKPFMHSGPSAVSRGGLLGAAIALPKCCGGRIGMAPTASSRGLAESGMRVLVRPFSTPD